jgi:two-component system chemotaxis response regulator CheB
MEEADLKNRIKTVIMGGSAGSLSVLFEVLPALNSDLNTTIILVLHRKNSGDSSLSDLLAIKTVLPVKEIDDKDPVLPGNIYLAPADYHVLIEKDFSFSLDISEKVNFSRPSLDVTFESAAEAFGSSLAAILLSGSNNDGTAGLKAVQDAGGIIIVQNPETAGMAYMPQYAINNLDVDYILNAKDISALINSLG